MSLAFVASALALVLAAPPPGMSPPKPTRGESPPGTVPSDTPPASATAPGTDAAPPAEPTPRPTADAGAAAPAVGAKTDAPPADGATPTGAAPSSTTAPATDAAAATVTPPRPTIAPSAAAPAKPLGFPGQTRGARIGFIVAGSVLLAGSGALLGGMGYFISRSQKLERDGDRRVGEHPAQTDASSLHELVKDGRRANHAAVWTGVAAGVALSTAIGMLVSGTRSPRRQLTPALSRGGAGLVWTARF
jgi:hypothetical protein